MLTCCLVFIGIFCCTDTKMADILLSVQKAGWAALVAVLGLMFGQLIVQSFSWQILLKGTGYNINFSTICSSIFVGWSANFLTPSMYLGGEPVRAYILTKDECPISFSDALGSVFVHKFLEFAAFMFLILVSAVLVFVQFRKFLPIKISLAIVLCVSLLFLLLLGLFYSLAYKKRFFSWLIQFFGYFSIVKKWLEPYKAKINQMEEFIINSFHRSLRPTGISFLGMFFFEFLIFLRPLLFFIFFQRVLSFGELALIFLFLQLIQALQFTPGGIGILEGGTIGIMSMIGISPSDALCFATFCRIGDIAIVSLGFSLAAYFGLNQNFFKQASYHD